MNAAPLDRAKRDEQLCVVAVAPCCGNMVYASVDDHWDDAAKKELADLVIDGYKISKMPSVEVRKLKWGCKCPRP